MKNYLFKILFTCCFSVFTLNLVGQTPTDVVHLKTGQIYQGFIVEQKPGESILLWQLPEDDTLSFRMEDIDRLTRFILPIERPVLLEQAPPDPAPDMLPFYQKRNYVFVQGCAGGGDYPFAGAGLRFSHRLERYEQLRVGIGVHFIDNKKNGTEFSNSEFVRIVPLMLDLRHQLTATRNGRFSTSVFFDGGYAFNFTANDIDQYGDFRYGDGWAIHPGISFQFAIARDFGVALDLGWMHHTSRREWLAPVQRSDRKAWNDILIGGAIFF